MRNQIEVTRQIRIHHLHLTSQHGLLDFIHCLMGPAFRPVSTGVVVEVRLQDWLQHDHRLALHHPVFHRRNAQRAAFGLGLILPHLDA